MTDYKEKEIEKLSNKYFWQQKRNEVLMFVGAFSLFIQVPYWFGKSIEAEYGLAWFTSMQPANLLYWCVGFMIIFFAVLAVAFLYGLLSVLINWLESNQKQATERAIKEVQEDPFLKLREELGLGLTPDYFAPIPRKIYKPKKTKK